MKTPKPITDTSGSMPGTAPGSGVSPILEENEGRGMRKPKYEYWELHCKQYTKPHLVKLSRQHPEQKGRPYRYEFALAMQLLYPTKCSGTTAQDITGMQELTEETAETKFGASRFTLPIRLGQYTFYKKDSFGCND